MRKFTILDNETMSFWGLTIQEGFLFEWMFTLPSWANKLIVEGEVFYFASKNKACDDLPMLTDKPDTMYRYYKKLQAHGLIEIKKLDGKDYIQLMEKSKSWNKSDWSDKNPSIKKEVGKKSEVLENNPPEVGQTSESSRKIIRHIDTSITDSNIIEEKNVPSSKNSLIPKEKIIPGLFEKKETNLDVQILSYLNAKKPSKIDFKETASNLSHIRARLKEKFLKHDFEAVIDFKISEWKDSQKMKKYIRPSTLFGEKFNSYVLESQDSTTSGDGSENFEEHETTMSDLK